MKWKAKEDSKVLEDFGTMYRNISFNNRAAHEGIFEIDFEWDTSLESRIKCLVIAAALLIVSGHKCNLYFSIIFDF
jgi:hypothetical protein